MTDKQKTNPKVEWGYFAVTPRILRTQYKQLSHTEKWLYTCLKDLCGDKGMCYRALRVLAQETDLSIGNLSTGIRHLHDAGLIHAEKKRRSANPTAKEVWHISIVDIWKSNVEHCSNFEHSAENVQDLNNNVQNLNNPPLERSNYEQKRSNFDDRRKNTEEQQYEERTVEEQQAGVSANASTPPALSSSEDNFSEEDEVAPTVKMPAVRLNGHIQQPPNETPYHIAEGAIGNEEPVLTAPRLTLPSKGASHDRISSGLPGQSGRDVPSSPIRHSDYSDTHNDELDLQQTPGPGALPSAVTPPSDRSHGITSDQATSARVVSSPPTTQGSHEHHDAAATPDQSEPRASDKSAKQSAPKRGRGKQAVEPEPVPEEAIRIMDDWDVLMKRACPRTTGEKGTIAAAVSLVPCHPSREVLKSVWQFCFKSNPDWYRTHGVGLQDISKNIGKWQSLQVPEEPVPLVDAKKPTNWVPADDDYSIAALAQIQERRLRREAERGV